MSSPFETLSSRTATGEGLPEVVIDANGQREYFLGEFLGQGNFAQCYEFLDKKKNAAYAGKVFSKEMLQDERIKENLTEEISIHKTLRHNHVVRFHSHFEDDSNLYIILELCTKRSLKEILQDRETLTETEVRNYLRQLLLALEYLVQESVIHRDLKPSNLLLNENMQLKIADFGFACRVRGEEELLQRTCGTLNYLAPEVLAEKGHSYKSDLWAVGCIMYELLVGHPPFLASDFMKTYARINNHSFKIPWTVSTAARSLILWMLHPEPAQRPCIEAIMKHDFMTKG